MWNELSMKDRAKYIKLGVQNGIKDIATIRQVYNKLEDGGPIYAEPESVKRALTSRKPAYNYSEAVDMDISPFRENLTRAIQSTGLNIPTRLSNCTLTASQWINPKRPIGRAVTIVTKPKENGFRQVEEDYRVPGTLVIASKDPSIYRDGVDNLYHSMLLTGFADRDYDYTYGGKKYKIKRGEPLVSYSRGKSLPSEYRENIPLKVYNDQGEGKTYNRYYNPINANEREVLLPVVTITSKEKNNK